MSVLLLAMLLGSQAFAGICSVRCGMQQQAGRVVAIAPIMAMPNCHHSMSRASNCPSIAVQSSCCGHSHNPSAVLALPSAPGEFEHAAFNPSALPPLPGDLLQSGNLGNSFSSAPPLLPPRAQSILNIRI